MALFQSDWAKGKKQARVPAESGVVVTEIFEYTTTAEVALNDIIEIGAIPAFARVTDMILEVDDLDTGTAAITLDVGVMSGDFGDPDDARTSGDEFFDGATTAQAGGLVRMSERTGFNVAATGADRGIGVKAATAADTWANGTVRLFVSYIQN